VAFQEWTRQAWGVSGTYGSRVADQHKDWVVRNLFLTCGCTSFCACSAVSADEARAENLKRSNVPHCPWPTYEDVQQWAHSEGVGAAMGQDETANTGALELATLAAIDDISEDTGLPYILQDADGVNVDADGVALADGVVPVLCDVPVRVNLATTMHAARLYRRRMSPDGTLGASAFGGAIRVSKYDPDVRELLANWLRVGVA